MSSFYDDASLVVIPSGYKTSKVYAEKPTDGSGDLAFTRTGDTATRVNSAGLVEKVRTNLVLQSQTFDNASWTKDGATVTANSTTAPDGTTTADKVLETATTAVHNVYQAPTLSSNVYSFSVFVKKAERFKCALADRNTGAYVAFNINTGVIIESLVFSGKIESYSNDWYRLTITTPSAYSVFDPQVFILPDSYTTGVPALITYAGSATSGLFVWAAQLEVSDFGPTSYIPTTTAAVSVGPVANVPRLDYLGSTCPRLLLEPQRTNALLQADTISVSNWIYSQSTLTSNVTGPDGYSSGRRITNGVTATDPYAEQSITTSVNTFTFSAFVKQGTAAQAWLYPVHVGMGGDTSYAQFTFATKTFVNVGNIATSGYQEYANGWYRIFCSVVVTGAVSSLRMRFSNGQVANVYNDWAFPQVEIGAYATSYIPTLAASATRGADACSKTGISSLIGQTEGVAFIDFVWNGLTGVGSYPRIIELATDSNNYIQLFSIAGTTSFMWDVLNGGVVQFTGSSTMALGRNKIAIGYKLNDMVVYRNGTLLASDTSCTVPATSALGVTGTFDGSAGAQLAASVNQTLLFKTRLTNAELATLTTL